MIRAERLKVLLALLAATPFLGGVDLLLRRSPIVEQGNGHMKAGKAEEALAEYDKAMGEAPGDPGVHFNRGTALYGLSRWEEAAEAFLRATLAGAPELKAAAFYNLGNAFFQGQKYDEAVQAFKKSLAYNPGDLRAKWNLELALKQKKEEDKKKEEQKKSDNKDNKDNKDKQDKQEEKKGDKKEENASNEPESDKNEENDPDKNDSDKSQQDEQKEDPAKQPQAKQDPPKPEPKNGEKKPEQQPKPEPEKQAKNQASPGEKGKDPSQPPPNLSEMEAILDNLERSPKELERQLARIRALNRRPPVKDW